MDVQRVEPVIFISFLAHSTPSQPPSKPPTTPLPAINPKGTSKMVFSVEAKYNLGAAKYTVTVEAPKSGDANPQNNVLKGAFPGKL